MHNEVTKALYDVLAEEDKNDFYNAYLHLKHIQHFAYHAKEMGSISIKSPEKFYSKFEKSANKAMIRFFN